MATTKPTFLFAPGAWHQPSCYDIVRQKLESQGYPTVAVTYPSVGAEPPNKSAIDDVAATRAELEKLIEQEGKQVVLVVHSYGGIVGANAVQGLGAKQRSYHGKTGGVVQFVYLSAFVTPLGKSVNDLLGGQFLPWMRREGDYVYADTPENIFYHDVEPGLQQKALADLRHQSAAVYFCNAEYEPWHDIDTFYLFCDEDRAVPLPYQEAFAAALGPNAGSYHVQGSHSPFLSVPDDTVKGLVAAAELVA